MSTEPIPTVYVYGEITTEVGAQYWLRYIVTGTDHEEAANIALRSWSGLRVHRVETFDGEPQLWYPGASRYYDVGVRKEPA